jgi:PTH1 family peptidyl-tRNA hydrolase
VKLIVGLGNPGDTYIDSRHNIGFSVVDALGKDCRGSFKRDRGTFAFTAKGKLGNKEVILAEPVTFMNLSGVSVKALLKKYKIDLGDLLVVCDDLDLELGRIKIRPAGSSGGHHGLESIIDNIRSQDFARLRVGIGRPHPGIETSDYVLSQFKRKEKEIARQIIDTATRCCHSWLTKNIQETMSMFNKRSREEKE